MEDEIRIDSITNNGSQNGNNNFQINHFYDNNPNEIIENIALIKLSKIRISRFLTEDFNEDDIQDLFTQLVDGDLKSCPNKTKSIIIAWCSRLSVSKDIGKAKEMLGISKTFGNNHEIKIAEAFILSKEGDGSKSLAMMQDIRTPESVTASFLMIHNMKESNTAASLKWFNDAGLKFSELDSEGMYFYIVCNIASGNFEKIKECVAKIPENYYSRNPLLYYIIGIYTLTKVVPTEFKSKILSHDIIHMQAKLNDSATGIKNRNLVIKYFENFKENTKSYQFTNISNKMDDYILWLKLNDKTLNVSAKKELQKKLEQEEHKLRMIPLALIFDVKFDIDSSLKEISQNIIRSGGIASSEIVLAQWFIALHKYKSNKLVEFIESNRDNLYKFLNEHYVSSVEITALAKSGDFKSSEMKLEIMKEKGVSETHIARIKFSIEECRGTDSIGILKDLYNKSTSIFDLTILVNRLEKLEDWQDLIKYSGILFFEVHNIENLETLVRALSNNNDSSKVIELAETYGDDFLTSVQLTYNKALALFNLGRFYEAKKHLDSIDSLKNRDMINNLYINIVIASGEWDYLHVLIEKICSHNEGLSSETLLYCANIANSIQSNYFEKLLCTAVERDNSNPNTLIQAYQLAIRSTGEMNIPSDNWLKKAISLSSDTGPVKAVSLSEVVEISNERQTYNDNVYKLYSNGDISISLAGEGFNQSLAELYLLSLLVNDNEEDVRKHSIIPAYSGCKTYNLDYSSIDTISLDPTSLLTLGFLDLFNYIFDTFSKVMIPHTTLNWLFDEKRKLTYHQPQSIKLSKKILELINDDKLQVFKSPIDLDPELSDQIGLELATLLTKLSSNNYEDSLNAEFVVMSSPIYKNGSLMEEHFDTSEYSHLICNCTSIIEWLKQKGILTTSEYDTALRFISSHDSLFNFKTDLKSKDVIYLDNVSLSYFQTLNLIEKIVKSGLTIYILDSEFTNCKNLVAHEHILDESRNIIEHIRLKLSEGIKSQKIIIDDFPILDNIKNKDVISHPCCTILKTIGKVDAVCIDDRFLNKSNDNKIINTQELLLELKNRNVITSQIYYEKKAKLRSAGFLHIHITEEEIENALQSTTIIDNIISETFEMKAIKNNILKVKMTNFLILPSELPWLINSSKVLTAQIIKQWSPDIKQERSVLLSNWLFDLIDIRGWAHNITTDKVSDFISNGNSFNIMPLFTANLNYDDTVKNNYMNWLDSNILPLIEEDFKFNKEITEYIKDLIKKFIQDGLFSLYKFDDAMKNATIINMLNLYPKKLVDSVLLDDSFCKEVCPFIEPELSFNDNGPSFIQSTLYTAIREIHNDKTNKVELYDSNENLWILKTESEENKKNLVLTKDDKELFIDDIPMFSPNIEYRLQTFRKQSIYYNLPIESINKWEKILSERQLFDNEIQLLKEDYADTIIKTSKIISAEATDGECKMTSLAPISLRYYQRIIGRHEDDISLDQYLKNHFTILTTELIKKGNKESLLQIIQLCLMSSMSEYVMKVFLNLPNKLLIETFEYLKDFGDVFSMVAAVEIGFGLITEKPILEDIIVEIIKTLSNENPTEETSIYKLQSLLCMQIDAFISYRRVLSSMRPFMRRLATFSQAGVAMRSIRTGIKKGVSIESYNEEYYYKLQNLVDMRLEPKWLPQYIYPVQIKNNCISRIIYSYSKYNIKSKEINILIKGKQENNLKSFLCYPFSYFHGPLEGGCLSSKQSSESFQNIINDKLTQGISDDETLALLVNNRAVYDFNPTILNQIREILKKYNYRLPNINTAEEANSLLYGLSMISAITRDTELAIDVIYLLKKHYNKSNLSISIDDYFTMILVSAGAYEDLQAWCDFIGKWITDLAFSEIKFSDSRNLLKIIKDLCHIVPDLWAKLGRAEAALQTLT